MLEFKREKKPFRQGPSGRGASSSYTSNSSYRGRNDYNDKRGKIFSKFGKCKLPQELLDSRDPVEIKFGLPTPKHDTGQNRICTQLCKATDSTTKRSLPNDGKVKMFSQKLGKTVKRQVDPRHSQKSKYRISKKSGSKISTKRNKNGRISKSSSGSGNKGVVEKGGNIKVRNRERPICELNFLKREKRRNFSTNNQSKISKLSHFIPKVQNGRPKTSSGSFTTQRFYGKNRHERCIFQCSSPPSLQEICKIFVERNSLRISLPLFRTGSRPEDFHKITESPNSTAKASGNKASDLSRRHFDFGRDFGNYSPREGHSNLPSTKSRICDQYQKIDHGTLQEDRIFRSFDRLGDNDNISPRRKNEGHYNSLSRLEIETKNNFEESNQDNREADFNILSCSTSPTKLQIFTNMPNRGTQNEKELRVSGDLNCPSSSRIRVVDSEFESLQWSPNLFEPSGHNNTIRCGKNRGLGSILSRDQDRGTVEYPGIQIPYKHSGTLGCKIGNNDFCKNEKSSVHSPTARQYSSTRLHSKNGKHKMHYPNQNQQRDLGVFTTTQDHDYARTHPRGFKLFCRPGVQECRGFQRMETPSGDILSVLQTPEISTRCRPLCVKTHKPTENLCGVETRPLLSSSRCPTTKMDSHAGVCIPPLFTSGSSLKKDTSRESNINSRNSPLANTTLVSTFTTVSLCKPSPTAKKGKPLSQPTRALSPPSKRPAIRSMACIREEGETTDLPQNVTELISDARAAGTRKAYKSSWVRWSSWCSTRKADPFRTSISNILSFLTDCFDKGQEYRTINKHRSAISASHEPINGIPVGQIKVVCDLLKGISNRRPPKTKLLFVWDIGQVLNFIREMGPNNSLSNKSLTYKTAALLSICTIQRGSEMTKLDTKYMFRSDTCYVLGLQGRIKHSRQGKSNPPIYLTNFPQDTLLCPVTTLDAYLQRSAPWRASGESKIFLSIIEPHHPITSKTMARWLLELLKMSGLNTENFTAHSFRSAGSSKAASLGVSLRDILKQGHWTNENVWQKHYNKAIIDKSTFQNYILKIKKL